MMKSNYLVTTPLMIAFCFAVVSCGNGSTGSQSATKDRTKAKANSAVISVSQGGSTTQVYSSLFVECRENLAESFIRVSDPSREVSFYFSIQNSQLSTTKLSMKTPTSGVYFDAEYKGRVLAWDPSLQRCDLQLERREGSTLRGNLDCYRTRTEGSMTSVVNLQSQFVCLIDK